MRSVSSLVAALALVAATAQAADRAVVVGGYSPVAKTPQLTKVLFDALHNEATYAKDVHARLCVAAVASVEQQVVAGMNYRFTTTACDIRKTLLLKTNQSPPPARVSALLGECTHSFARNCVRVDAVVTVYKSLSDATSVSSVVVTADKPAEPEEAVVVHVHAKQF